jgi:hypothetical protein
VSFWPFIKKKPQVYAESEAGHRTQYSSSGRGYGYMPESHPPQGHGYTEWIDNQQDWISLGGTVGIRSDGTLWKFYSYNALDVWEIEGKPRGYGPIQVGTDTDWASVSYPHILKKDGSLWVIDSMIGLGIRSRVDSFEAAKRSNFYGQTFSGGSWGGFDGSSNPGGLPFRAVISSPIQSANVGSGWMFSKKPSLSLFAESLSGSWSPTTLVGEGAELEAVWSGFIGGISLLGGGSGYTSPPAVNLIPQDGEEPSEAVLWPVMQKTGTQSFVGGGGTGYTAATATDPVTGATANAIIENGAIVGWTMTSSGSASRDMTVDPYKTNPDPPQSTEAIVSGDGTGGVAECVPLPSSISAIFIGDTGKSSGVESSGIGNPEIWKTPPLIQIEGGGGTGANAAVSYILGSVKDAVVTNAGSGYTQGQAYRIRLRATPAGGDSFGQTRDLGGVTLAGGPVARIDGPPVPVAGAIYGLSLGNIPLGLNGANLGSTGRLRPTAYQAWYPLGYGSGGYEKPVDVKIVGNGGKSQSVDFFQTEEWKVSFSIPDSGGWGDIRPQAAIYTRPPNFMSTPFQSVDEVKFQSNSNNQIIQCNTKTGDTISLATTITSPQLGSYAYSYAIPTIIAWADSISVSAGGAKMEWSCVDGSCFPTSGDYSVTGSCVHDSSLDSGKCPPPGSSSPASVDTKYSSHPAAVHRWDIGGFSYWDPASLPEVAIVCCPADSSSDGSTPAWGTSSPEQGAVYNGYRSVSLSSYGSGFKTEPPVWFLTNTRPYPVRVGSDTWKSVCLSGSLLYDFIGVNSAGEGFCWLSTGPYGGQGGRRYATSPQPIGRGVSLTLETESLPTPIGVNGNLPLASGGGVSRFDISPPEYGTESPSFSIDSLVVRKRHSHAFQYGKVSECSGETKLLALVQGESGFGYTSLPTINFLSSKGPGEEIKIKSEFIGPSKFSGCQGGLFFDTDGNAWCMDNQSRSVSAYRYDFSTVTTEGRGNIEFYRHSEVEVYNAGLASISYIPTIDSGVYRAGTDFAIASYGPKTRLGFRGTKTESGGGSGLTGCEYEGTYLITEEIIEAPLTRTLAETPTLADGRLSWTGIYSTDAALSQYQSWSTVPPSVTIFGDAVGVSLADVAYPMQKIEGVKSLVQHYTSSLNLALTKEGTVACYVARRDMSFGAGPGYLVVDSTFSGFGSSSGSLLRRDADGSLWQPARPSDFYGGYLVPNLSHALDFSLKVLGGGSGYTEPPQVVMPPVDGNAAEAHAIIDGKVVAVCVIKSGSGFSSPPSLTVVANDELGSGATLEAVIEGPVYDTKVTSPGSKYRCPPEVLFSLNGIPAEGTAKCSGPVQEVVVAASGGGFRETPDVVFYGEGSGAAAQATIKGYVESVPILSGGAGYTSSPTVSFSGGGGSGAEAVAVLSETTGGKYRVHRIVVTNGGSNYSSMPTVAITGGGGSGASATGVINAKLTEVQVTSGGSGYGPGTKASVSSGDATLEVKLSLGVDSISISDAGTYRNQPTINFSPFGHIDSLSLDSGGSGYASAPLVGIVGPCGTGATATCSISGEVSQIVVTKAGSGYTNPPIVELIGGYDPVEGSAAKAHAVCSGGLLTSIVIDEPGSGYFAAPGVSVGRLYDACLSCKVDAGKIQSVEVLSGGYGYTAEPVIQFPGGTGATFSSSIQGGIIESVSVTNGGSGYTDGAMAVVLSGIGSGGAAAAKISAEVSSVAVTDCGQGFELNEPVKVIFSGGSGSGASATATVASAGSGASATARINGSVIHANITNQGSGYQHSPSVTVDMSQNFLLADDPEGDYKPYLQTRILGELQSLVIDNPGSSYGIDSNNVYGRKKTEYWQKTAAVADYIAPLGSPISSLDKQEFLNYLQGRGWWGGVPDAVNRKFTSPPPVEFSDSVSAGCSIVAHYGGASFMQGTRPYANRFNFRVSRQLSGIIVAGSLVQENYARVYTKPDGKRVSVVGAIDYSQQQNLLPIDTVYLPSYSTMPTVYAVDVRGQNASATMSSQSNLTLSGGSFYTSKFSCIFFRGGVPSSWGSPPVLQCQMDSFGKKITAIAVSSNGSQRFFEGDDRGFDGFFADVYLTGGGEAGGSLSRAGRLKHVWSPTEEYEFVAEPGLYSREFSSTPSAVVVVLDAPSHRHSPPGGMGINHWARNIVPTITNLTPDSTVRGRSPWSGRGYSPLEHVGHDFFTSRSRGIWSEWPAVVNQQSPYDFEGDGIVCFDHFHDGVVDHAWIENYPEEARWRTNAWSQSASAGLSPEGGGDEVAFKAMLGIYPVRWSGVYWASRPWPYWPGGSSLLRAQT